MEDSEAKSDFSDDESATSTDLLTDDTTPRGVAYPSLHHNINHSKSSIGCRGDLLTFL